MDLITARKLSETVGPYWLNEEMVVPVNSAPEKEQAESDDNCYTAFNTAIRCNTGLSGSVLGKLPSRFQDEKHIFCENYVGFSCIARVVLNRTWKYFQVEIRTICSLKNKGHQRASKSRLIFHIGGPHIQCIWRW